MPIYRTKKHLGILWITRRPELFSSRHSVFEDGLMRAGTLTDLCPDKPAGIGRCDPPQHAPKRKLAFELFNRVAPPPGVMRGALLERLGRA